MHELVAERPEVASRVALFDEAAERGIDREDVLERAVLLAGLANDEASFLLAIRALISPTCPSTRSARSRSPFRMALRVSMTQRGQSESVSRGQPSGGRLRSRLFGSGRGAHSGLGEGLSSTRS